MLELTTTRHNPLIDPTLDVWRWEIPLYLFVGGIVAGLMVLGGLAMLRTARGDDGQRFFSMQAPLLGVVLMSVGMLALLLDLSHKLYVWRLFTTLQPTSPMSWGSWLLLVVYGVLLVSALLRLHEVWPWLGRRVPQIQRASDAIVARPAWLRGLGWANVLLGIGLGIYTGVLLNTMVARPLWNSAILAPLFLFSGLSAGAAALHLAALALQGRPPGAGAAGGALSALLQPLAPNAPPRATAAGLIRADQLFIAIELVLLALLLVNLHTSSASHAVAAQLITTGPYALAFWVGVVGLGAVLPLVWQQLELGHRVRHTALPALLVLAGSFLLRWVVVSAGQASEVVPVLALG